MTERLENQEVAGSDEQIRMYLLGSLPPEDRLAVDELLLADDEFAERVQLAESVLIDDFVAKKLNAREEELFTTRFLVTDARREALRLSSGLHDYASKTQVRPVGFFSFESPRTWAAASALAILVLVVGMIWFAYKQQKPNPQIAQHDPTTINSPEVTASPVTIPEPQPPASPSSVETQPPVTTASFVLLPGATRGTGEMARIAIPGGERDIVRISLVLENPEDGNYFAELVTAEGQKVLVRPNLKPVRNGHVKIVLSIPASLLHARDYQIKLSRKSAAGANEAVGRYYFRALEE